MRRILLAGAPTGCWTNLGDEAILSGMAASLRTAWPEAELAVVSSNPAGFLDRYGCEAVPFRDVPALAGAVAASDLVLLGGGSIFFDYWGCDPDAVLTPRHQGLSLWTGIALLAAACDKPLMVYGAGVGPLRSAYGRLLARVVFELAHAVCVRDRESKITLDSLGLEGVAATITGDAALRVCLPPTPKLELARPWLGVALRQWDVNADSEHWQTETAAALDRFLEQSGGTVLLVQCHRPVRWPLTNDGGISEAVRQRMALRDQVYTIDIELPWAERAAVLSRCDQVFAMRYHAVLFALAAAVPTVSLSYDPKVESLMADWGFEELSVRLEDASREALAQRLEHARRKHADFAATARQRVTALRAREHGNIEQAQQLLSGPRLRKLGGRAVHKLLAQLAKGAADRPAAVTSVFERLAGNSTMQIRSGGRKRVAILTNQLLDRETGAPCVGGAERYALELACLLSDLGFTPMFFQRGGAWGEGKYFGFPVVALPRGKHFSEFEPGVGEEFFHRTQDFDHVFYLMSNYASGPMREDALAVCHGVWWDHNLYREGFAIRTPEWYEHLERAFARPRKVVSVDTNSINVMRALFPAAAERMVLIPNWVDTERFHPPAERKQRKPLILIPRRAVPIRGTELMGPILDRLPEGCHVVWAGDGSPPQLKALRQIAARDARFELRAATFEEMPDLYRSADICLIPSVGSEGQSLACLEAMASGCAVVATRVGGLPELIQDGVNGLVRDPSPDAIASAARRLLQNPQLRRDLGAAARSTAERHSLIIWRDRWEKFLAELGWVEHAEAATSYDIVCFSIINWEFRWQRPQQMMALWARRGRRVFYLRITDFLPVGGKPIAAKPLAENVWEVRIALPREFSFYSGEHPDSFATVGLEALRTLREEFEIKRAAAVVQFASWTPLACAARKAFGWPLVYDCMDDWSAFPGLRERVPLLTWEEELLSTADRVVVSSRTIQERWANRRTDLILARNAADFAFFQKAEGEDPLPDVEGPVAGFFGAIAEWFDRDLMAFVAKARPEVTFVLVGGVHRISVSELEKLPNVRFEGWQPYAKMPLYLRRFDVCLVPFEVSPATNGMDVVKLYEYFSQGKPVVTTPIREILIYSALLYLAEDERSFARQLDRALNENDPALRARRIELARQNTWDERLDRIEAGIGKMTNGFTA
jgi:polysaccharide pyruvyl transferase CsaB